MHRTNVAWINGLLEKAIKEAMAQLGIDYLPSQGDVMKLKKPFEIDGQKIKPSALVAKMNSYGYFYLAEEMGLKMKGEVSKHV